MSKLLSLLALAFFLSACAQNAKVELFLCPPNDCSSLFIAQKNGDAKCAFFNLNLPEVKAATKNFSIVMHSKGQRGLLHHKFCVIGEKVWTGSWNPTMKSQKMANSVLIINSKKVARVFEKEFEALKSEAPPPKTKKTDGIVITFCPYCRDPLLKAIKKARKSVLFASYAFSDWEIAKVLKEKSENGVFVFGVVDKSQSSRVPRVGYVKLVPMVHHKFFVIDEKVVALGSANPTFSGLRSNRENIVIFKNPEIAEKLSEEVFRLGTLQEQN